MIPEFSQLICSGIKPSEYVLLNMRNVIFTPQFALRHRDTAFIKLYYKKYKWRYGVQRLNLVDYLNAAAATDKIDLLINWYRHNRYSHYSQEINGDWMKYGSLKVCKFVMLTRRKTELDLLIEAAIYGHMHIITWAYEQQNDCFCLDTGTPVRIIPDSFMLNATIHGQLDALKFGFGYGGQFDSEATLQAAIAGYLDVVQFVINNGGLLNAEYALGPTPSENMRRYLRGLIDEPIVLRFKSLNSPDLCIACYPNDKIIKIKMRVRNRRHDAQPRPRQRPRHFEITYRGNVIPMNKTLKQLGIKEDSVLIITEV